MSGATGIVGTMREVDGRGVVRMEARYATTAEDLWEAVTTPERLARWLGDVEGDLRVGGRYRATFVSSWSGTGVVEVCDAPRHLRTRMEDEGEETVVEATLTPQEDGVLLVVEESGLPLPGLPAYGAGWQVHLEDLGHLFEGTDRTGWRARWAELRPAYAAQGLD